MNIREIVKAKGKGYLLHWDDETKKPAWTPDDSRGALEVGKPLPDGWTISEGDYGPRALPPKKQGAPTAFRNTREGFLMEQDFMNRRTALMQAVTARPNYDPHIGTVKIANDFYAWLSKKSSPSDHGEALGEEAVGVGGSRSYPDGGVPTASAPTRSKSSDSGLVSSSEAVSTDAPPSDEPGGESARSLSSTTRKVANQP